MSIDSKNAISSGFLQENFRTDTTSSKKSLEKHTDPSLDNTLCAIADFVADPRGFFAGKRRKGTRQLLRLLLSLRGKFKIVWIGKDRIAQKIGYSSRHVDRMITQLIEWGLISKVEGGYNKANEYYFNPIFDHPTYRAKLSTYFPSLRAISLVLLASVNFMYSQSKNENVTANHKAELFNSNSSTEIERLSTSTYPSSQSESLIVCARVATTALHCNKKVESREQSLIPLPGRAFMKQESLTFIDKGLKSLVPTKWGKANISCFPVTAIAYADSRMMKVAGVIQDAGKMFMHFLWDYCKQNKVSVDFSIIDGLKERNPQLDTLPLIEKVLVSPVEGRIPPKRDEESQPTHVKMKQDAVRKQDSSYRDPIAFGRQSEWNGAIDIIKQQKETGTAINPFMQIMLELDGVKDQPWTAMAEILANSDTNLDTETPEAVELVEAVPVTHTREEHDDSISLSSFGQSSIFSRLQDEPQDDLGSVLPEPAGSIYGSRTAARLFAWTRGRTQDSGSSSH